MFEGVNREATFEGFVNGVPNLRATEAYTARLHDIVKCCSALSFKCTLLKWLGRKYQYHITTESYGFVRIERAKENIIIITFDKRCSFEMRQNPDYWIKLQTEARFRTQDLHQRLFIAKKAAFRRDKGIMFAFKHNSKYPLETVNLW